MSLSTLNMPSMPTNLFTQTLQDLIRGLRSNKSSEQDFIAQCLSEIKEELKTDSISAKSNAITKLTYIHMLGHDISFAAFPIIEVMSAPKYINKRVGYLAASQSFEDNTDVLMLTTNMLKKDLMSQNQFDTGLALNGLANFVTPDLARDLANDIITLTSSSRPYIRKKSVLALYKVFLRYPEALRVSFPRLKEKLDDPDPSVQCAAVCVICELARKNPKNYLSLAPVLFKLLQTTNNWMLIKIVKLFAALMPHEPRLAKKLLGPLTNIINSTPAMSLLYESINTVIQGLPNHSAAMQLCASKLRLFIENSDQNLKYLGLCALGNIIKVHPKLVSQHRDIILPCLDSPDESIRMRAMALLVGMASKKSLPDIVKRLLSSIENSNNVAYRDDLIGKLIDMCHQNNYQFITDFEWYFNILISLIKIEGTQQGNIIAEQLLDLVIRVEAIRPYAVPKMADLVTKGKFTTQGNIFEVVSAAIWVCCEFSQHLKNRAATFSAFLSTSSIFNGPYHVQASLVHNLMKLYIKCAFEDGISALENSVEEFQDQLVSLSQSSDVEVQERTCNAQQLLDHILGIEDAKEQENQLELMNEFYNGVLNPVASKAQKKIAVPDNLNLDEWINEEPSSSESEQEEEFFEDTYTNNFESGSYNSGANSAVHRSSVDVQQRLQDRKMNNMSNPHYLFSNAEKPGEVNVDNIPIKELNLDGKKIHRKKKSKRRKSAVKVRKPEYVVAPIDNNDGSDESAKEENDDPHRALDIDLDAPLSDSESLPIRTHHQVAAKEEKKPEPRKKRHEKAREDKDRRRSSAAETKDRRHHKDRGDARPKKDERRRKSRESHSSSKSAPKEDIPPTKERRRKSKSRSSRSRKESDASAKPSSSSSAASSSSRRRKKREDPSSSSSKGPQKDLIDVDSEKSSKGTADLDFWIEDPAKIKKRSSKPIDEKDLESILSNPGQTEISDSYQLLVNSDTLQVHYTTEFSDDGHSTFFILLLKNNSKNTIQNIEFNILDILNFTLDRPAGGDGKQGIPVPFDLPPNFSNETKIKFDVQSIMKPMRLNGVFSFFIKDNEDNSSSDKLDFTLNLPVSSFIKRTECEVMDFLNIIQEDDMNSALEVHSKNVLDKLAKYIVSSMNFTVVEHIKQTYSFYGKSMQGHHICLLVFEKTEDVEIKIKATNTELAEALQTELSALSLGDVYSDLNGLNI